jgi:hypothetical protein
VRPATHRHFFATHEPIPATACEDKEQFLQFLQVFLKKYIDAPEVIFRDSLIYTRSGKLAWRLIFLFILRAADINNLDFFKVISRQFFTIFLPLRPFFKTVSKILNRNACHFSLSLSLSQCPRNAALSALS